jgi:mRNA interferase RelE/StbE
MRWDLIISSPATRDLRHVPRSDLLRVDAALNSMRDEPYGGDTKVLRGGDGVFRRRVGVWRITFELRREQHLVVVLRVKRRSSKTY